jgi:hypothetical protein
VMQRRAVTERPPRSRSRPVSGEYLNPVLPQAVCAMLPEFG